jgi:hypothetical protein
MLPCNIEYDRVALSRRVAEIRGSKEVACSLMVCALRAADFELVDAIVEAFPDINILKYNRAVYQLEHNAMRTRRDVAYDWLIGHLARQRAYLPLCHLKAFTRMFRCVLCKSAQNQVIRKCFL